VEGLLFHPKDPEKMWVWHGSMGDWTGVRYSEDGGVTWQSVQVYGENRIYGVVFNPFTGELLVTGRQVISRWYNGKEEDLRDNCGLSENADFIAGPPLLNLRGKDVLIPVFVYEDKRTVSGIVYACRGGKVKKVTTFSVQLDSPVYVFLSKGKLYLSFMNSKGPGQVLEYPLLTISVPWWWAALGGALVTGILANFFLRRKASSKQCKR
jgi:hypothetical protein